MQLTIQYPKLRKIKQLKSEIKLKKKKEEEKKQGRPMTKPSELKHFSVVVQVFEEEEE
jgi:hypothetical protein